ncbi:MAG: glycoside hydrolase family 18 protein [Anaerolineae bacterium]|nr:glycoside hydrolase family 18 protein [Anaerolineae bacterium]
MTAQDESFRVVGYFASWSIYGDDPYLVTDIPADKLTHINYAFARISDDGKIAFLDEQADTQFAYPGDKDDQPLKGNFNQLRLLKEAHPYLQTLISIGGWEDSEKFSDVALTPESRGTFAQSVVDFVVRYGFDGVDIDWEYPTGGGDSNNITRPEDKDNFVLLLGALRDALDAQGEAGGRHYLLTIALGAGQTQYEPLDWAQIVPLLDFINVMTYDMVGPWSSLTDFNAPLYAPADRLSDDTTVQNLLGLGIPADKLVMGVPFYGYVWTNITSANNGLRQPNMPGKGNSLDYGEIAAEYVGRFERFWDETAQVPWLYDAASRTMISYDDPESMTLKAAYVREQGLGGVMFWEISQDSDDAALLDAIWVGLEG